MFEQRSYVSYLNGRTHDIKRGRRSPLGANIAVACRMVLAAANMATSDLQGMHSSAVFRHSGMSASSAAVKKGPHAVCAEAFVMPCSHMQGTHGVPTELQHTVELDLGLMQMLCKWCTGEAQ